MSLRYTENKLGTLTNQLVVLDAFARLPIINGSNITSLPLGKYNSFQTAYNSATAISATTKMFYMEDTSATATQIIVTSGGTSFTARVAMLFRKPNSTNYTAINFLRSATFQRSFVTATGVITAGASNYLTKIATSTQSLNPTSVTFYDYVFGQLNNTSVSTITGSETTITGINLGLTQTFGNLKEIPDYKDMTAGDALLWDVTNKKFFAEPMFDLYSKINVVTLSTSNTTYTIDDTTLPKYRKRVCYLVDANVSNLEIKLPSPNQREGSLVWISARTTNSNITITCNHDIMYNGVLNPTITLGGSTQSELRRCFFSDGTQWFYIGK